MSRKNLKGDNNDNSTVFEIEKGSKEREKIMTLMECATDCGRTYQTLLRWVKAGKIPYKRIGFKEIFIEPEDWHKFCADNGIVRKGANSD